MRRQWLAPLYVAAALPLIAGLWMYFRYTHVWDISPREVCDCIQEVWAKRWPADAYVRIAGETAMFALSDGTQSPGDVVEPDMQECRVSLMWVEDGSWPSAPSPSYVGRLLGGGGTALAPDDPDYASSVLLCDNRGNAGRIRPLLQVGAPRLGLGRR